MGTEIERKFLLDSIPESIVLIGVRHIEQNYLATGETEYRTRKEVRGTNPLLDEDAKYTSTTKEGSGLVRKEWELVIDKDTYTYLNRNNNFKPILKIRGYVRLNGLKIEVDRYLNPELNGLLIAEIEFDTAQQAVDADLPSWLSTDVTNDKAYKNQNLWKKLQVKPENNTHMEEDITLDGGTEVSDSHYSNEDVFKKNREVVFTTSSSGSSFTLEGVGTHGDFTLISSTTDKQSILLKAHNVVSYYEKAVIREWFNGEEVNRHTISRE